MSVGELDDGPDGKRWMVTRPVGAFMHVLSWTWSCTVLALDLDRLEGTVSDFDPPFLALGMYGIDHHLRYVQRD